ncbi:MAG: hypothetical protein NVS3B3_06630 [Aquirhabdus sp.]
MGCVQLRKVKSIGGCNFLGHCAVEYYDGTFGSESQAAIGKFYCKKNRWFLSGNEYDIAVWTRKALEDQNK